MLQSPWRTLTYAFNYLDRDVQSEIVQQLLKSGELSKARSIVGLWKPGHVKDAFLSSLAESHPQTYIGLVAETGTTEPRRGVVTTQAFEESKQPIQVVAPPKDIARQQYAVLPGNVCSIYPKVIEASTCTVPFNQDAYTRFNKLRKAFITSYMRRSGNGFGGIIVANVDSKAPTSPASASFWDSKQLLASALESKRRQIGFVVSLLFEGKSDTGHANAVIVDRDAKTIEYFEPHGTVSKDVSRVQGAVKKLLLTVPEFQSYEFSGADVTCPYFGPQALSGDAMCGHWSLMFLVSRIACPSINVRHLLDSIAAQGRDKLLALMSKFHCFLWNYIHQHKLDVATDLSEELSAWDPKHKKAFAEFELGNPEPLLQFKMSS